MSTSSIAVWSFHLRLRACPRMARTWASAALRSASALTTAAFLMSTCTWYGSRSSWTSKCPLLHALVVIHQDPGHLAGDPGRHERHVPVDVGVVGGDRLQHRSHDRDQEVSPERQAGHGPRPQQPSPPGARWRPGRRGRSGRRRIGRRVRGPVVRMGRGHRPGPDLSHPAPEAGTATAENGLDSFEFSRW